MKCRRPPPFVSVPSEPVRTGHSYLNLSGRNVTAVDKHEIGILPLVQPSGYICELSGITRTFRTCKVKKPSEKASS